VQQASYGAVEAQQKLPAAADQTAGLRAVYPDGKHLKLLPICAQRTSTAVNRPNKNANMLLSSTVASIACNTSQTV
jgi:hypothetical protein